MGASAVVFKAGGLLVARKFGVDFRYRSEDKDAVEGRKDDRVGLGSAGGDTAECADAGGEMTDGCDPLSFASSAS